MTVPVATSPPAFRVAVLAADPAKQDRLIALVRECGHQLMAPDASPDAILTDGAAAAASFDGLLGISR